MLEAMEAQTLYVLGGLLAVHGAVMLLGAWGARPGAPGLRRQLLGVALPAAAVVLAAWVLAWREAEAHWYVVLVELLLASALLGGLLLGMWGAGRGVASLAQAWPAPLRYLVLGLSWGLSVPVQLAVWVLTFLVLAATGCAPGAYECPV